MKFFTPVKWEREKQENKKILFETPIIPDLLIVHSSVLKLKEEVTFPNKLQYRYLRGEYQKKMIVPDADMKDFMQAMSDASYVEYYTPEEFAPDRIGEPITIKGGKFDGKTGILLSVNGTKKEKFGRSSCKPICRGNRIERKKRQTV